MNSLNKNVQLVKVIQSTRPFTEWSLNNPDALHIIRPNQQALERNITLAIERNIDAIYVYDWFAPGKR